MYGDVDGSDDGGGDTCYSDDGYNCDDGDGIWADGVGDSFADGLMCASSSDNSLLHLSLTSAVTSNAGVINQRPSLRGCDLGSMLCDAMMNILKLFV